MKKKTQIHDGIVGVLVLGSVLLGCAVNAGWLWLTGALGALLIFSAFSGFCPVYFVLNKIMKDSGGSEGKCC